MSNHSILVQNTLDGFSEASQHLYLTLLDAYQGHSNTTNELKALKATCRYEDNIGNTLSYILSNGPLSLDSKTKKELLKYFSERWKNNFI